MSLKLYLGEILLLLYFDKSESKPILIKLTYIFFIPKVKN